MKKTNDSISFHRTRAKDNMGWAVIVLILFACWMAFGSCNTYRGAGCQQHAKFIGYR